MNKKVLVLATLVIAMATTVKAQLNVGATTAPDASAALQISSTTGGLRLPQMSLTTTTTFAPVVTPTNAAAAIGLVIYNTNLGVTSSNTTYPALGNGVYYWDGIGWVSGNGATVAKSMDLRAVGTRNHVTLDAGVGSNGSSAGPGTDNIAIGSTALKSITAGNQNVAIGSNALTSASSATFNTAVGYNALAGITTGGNNTAFGNGAAATVSGGGGIVAIGYLALNKSTGTDNTVVGNGAGTNVIAGNYNAVFGSNAFANASGGASNNAMLGTSAGAALTTGDLNTAIGTQALSSQTSGSNNIALGYNTQVAVLNGSNQLNLGNIIYGGYIDGSGTGGNVTIGHGYSAAGNGYNTLEVNGTTRIVGSFVYGLNYCPQNTSSAYVMSQYDVQKTIFILDNAHYMTPLTLTSQAIAIANATPQDGQVLKIINRANGSVVINGTNTDNAASVTLVGQGAAGKHMAEYIWSRDAWVLMQ